MLLNNYQIMVENGAYLLEKNEKFILYEVKNGTISDNINSLEITRIKNNKYIPYKYELIKVNSYNPNEETIQNDIQINGVFVYVPSKKYINIASKSGKKNDKYPTVIKHKNALVYCSFDDLHDLLWKILECKEKNDNFDLSNALGCNKTTIKKNFLNTNSEKTELVEIDLLNKCKDPDLMKEISPWLFVSDILEPYRIDISEELINDDDYSFWGVVEQKDKYYVPLFVFDKIYVTEMIECYPTDIPDEKLPSSVKRILLPEENVDAIGVAYKKEHQNYRLRVWIKVEEYIRNFYKNSSYVKTNSQLEECVNRHLSILEENNKPLYYQLEKSVPPILFVYDKERIISECKEILVDLVQGELNRHLYGV